MSEACAAIAERLDPDLHRAAMFAPPGLRPRLMVLIAFDVELSRAGRASEKMIAAMRLQWWRDVVAEAFAGESRAHEVAGPLAALIQECNLPAAPFEALISTREAELQSPFSASDFEAWLAGRATPLLALGAQCAGAPHPGAVEAVGRAMALAFALRNGAAMAREGVYLLPFAGIDRAALARGETTPSQRQVIAPLAQKAVDNLARARRDGVPAGLKPVLRLGWQSEPLLSQAIRPDLELTAARTLRAPTLKLVWQGLTGGW